MLGLGQGAVGRVASRGALLGAAALAALLAGSPGVARAAGYATARYQGTLNATSWTWGSSEHDGGSYRLALSWEARASTAPGAPRWHFTKLTGTLHYDNDGAGPTFEVSCDATLAENPSYETSATNTAELFATPSGKVEASARLPLSGVLLSSAESGPSNCTAAGAVFGLEYAVVNEILHYNPSTAVKRGVEAALHPKATVPAGGPWIRRFDTSVAESDPNGGGGRLTLEISSSLLIGSTTGSSISTRPHPLPPYGPEFPKAKRAALADLRNHVIPDAVRYCLPFTTAATLLGTGVLTLGLGPAGGAGLLAVAGGLTAGALSPFCGMTIQRLISDYRTYRDPPEPGIGRLAWPALARKASLPACGGYHGAEASFCSRLRAAYAGLLAAGRAATASSTAIEKTVGREHAARLRRNRSAIALQDGHLRVLESRLSRQSAAERRAGARVASVLAAGRLHFSLTQARSAEAVALLERDLAGRGITAAALASADGGALSASARDLIADLKRL